MCEEEAASDDYIALAREAARSLVVLALAGERDALREFLTPDPQVPQVTYTVSCHATGEVVASHIRDFSDPSAAMCALVYCAHDTHEFAELQASSRAGVRYLALRR